MSESMKPKVYATFLSSPREFLKTKAYAIYQHDDEEFIKPRIYALYVENQEKTVNFTADLSRVTNADASVTVDTSRTIADNSVMVTANADLFRITNVDETVIVDTSRTIADKSTSITVIADTSRTVTTDVISVTLLSDISRVTNVDATVIADTSRNTSNVIVANFGADVQRKVSNAYTAVEDIVRNIVYYANLKADTKRSKYLTTIGKSDTRISIPVVITEQTSGLQSVSISASQSQLSDSVRVVTINPVEINGAVTGHFLDYELSMRAESTSQTGILQEINCMTDRDEILYKKIVYTGDADAKIYHGKEIYNESVANNSDIIPYMKMSKHMSKIAGVLGCNLELHSDDFISTCSLNDSGATYQSIISELCGWTSRIPNMFINAFLRGGTLYVVQRGHEPHEINIDNLKMTEPTIARNIMRTEWNNPQSTSASASSPSVTIEPDEDKDKDGDDPNADKQEPRVETSSDTKYAEDGGYTVTETTRKYEAISVLHDAVMISHESEKCTAYSAISDTSKTIEDGIEVYRGPSRDVTVTETETYHHYDAYGWHTTTTVTTVDGVLTEEHSSKSLGSTEGVTSFRANAAKDTKDTTTIGNPNDLNRYNSLVDTDFPVYGDYLETCKKDIRWLNRKVQETVTLSIYDYEHIFNFCDKILYKGNAYSIQSSSFLKDATTVNKQDLVLIRFY